MLPRHSCSPRLRVGFGLLPLGPVTPVVALHHSPSECPSAWWMPLGQLGLRRGELVPGASPGKRAGPERRLLRGGCGRVRLLPGIPVAAGPPRAGQTQSRLGHPSAGTPSRGTFVSHTVGMAPAGRDMRWRQESSVQSRPRCMPSQQVLRSVGQWGPGHAHPFCQLPAPPRPPLPYLMLPRPGFGHGQHCCLPGQEWTLPWAGHPRHLPRPPAWPVCWSLHLDHS